jgi:hypothetical protein
MRADAGSSEDKGCDFLLFSSFGGVGFLFLGFGVKI